MQISDQWVYASDNSLADDAPSNTTLSYTPDSNDIGQQLVCVETAYDPSTGGTASVMSVPTAAVAPEASATITQYSPALAGNIGEGVSGVSVTATLMRGSTAAGYTAIASGTDQTDSTGDWQITLAPTLGAASDAFGATGDELILAYDPSTATPGTTAPADATFTLGQNASFEDEASISSDGTVISSADVTNCSTLQFIIDGAAQPTSPNKGTGDCQWSRGKPLRDSNHVQAAETAQVSIDSTSDVADLTTVDDVGLVGVPASATIGVNNAPTCTADYVYGTVTCGPLNDQNFTITAGADGQVPLATTKNANGTYTGTATIDDMAPGLQITLTEAPGNLLVTQLSINRVLTMLTVGTLTVDAGLQSTSGPTQLPIADGGVCDAGKLVGSTDASGLCDGSSTVPSGLGAGPFTEFDDLSGGATVLNIPSLGDFIPATDASMPGGPWTAYALISGPGSPAQNLVAVPGVVLQIVPRGSSKPIFTQALKPVPNPDGPYVLGPVGQTLPVGLYWAVFTLDGFQRGHRLVGDDVRPAGCGSWSRRADGRHRRDGSPGARR